ncbi:MAG: two-component system, cell cycle sensor histidine kinase and response regulator CckA [Gaiellales bacterium]|nr:two-component system, cell cycle sensor histidine kinase and response regulator CckA [Gaiellales bacterium]
MQASEFGPGIKTDSELVRENSLLRSQLLEAVNAALICTDLGGRVSVWNRGAEELYGWTAEDAVGQQLLDLIVSDEDKGALGETAGALAAGGSLDRELTVNRKDGSSFSAHVRTGPIRNEAGAIIGAVEVSLDLTERNRQHEALRASEQAARESSHQFRRIVETANEGIWVIDAAARTTFANPTFAEMFGYTVGEMIGKTPLDLILDEDVAQADAHPESAQAVHRHPELEIRCRRKDGSELLAFMRRSALIGEDGAYQGCLGMVTDITEQARSRRDLVESERRLAEAQRIAFIGSWEWDLSTGSIHWSDEQFRLMGFEPQSFAPSYELVLERVHPEDREKCAQLVRDNAEPGESLQSDVRIVRPDGEVRMLDARAEVILNDDGSSMRMRGISQDITRRLELERERATLVADLHQSQRLESVGQLAGGIAHDFNNILAVIQSYAEFAIADSNGHVRADVEEIRRAAERAAALTHQLLTFSRREVTVPEPLDLNDVVLGTEKLLRRTLGEHVELVVDPSAGLRLVMADRGQLEQVLINLVVNGRDAMPTGGTLVVKTRNVQRAGPEGAEGDGVCLEVRDSGEGMSQTVRDHAFEPFFTTKEPGQGTGLGLATVFGIVREAGGDIRLESETGAGTTVTICLPSTTTKPGAEALPEEEPTEGRGELVLIVEDDEQVRGIARRILQSNGYRVLAANCGVRAMGLCRDHGAAIDLLITDVVMPGTAGPDLVDDAVELIPSLRVLYMSGYIDDEAMRQGSPSNPVALLRKPFGSDSLLRCVAKVLRNPPVPV